MAFTDENGIAKIVLTGFMGARVMQAYDENDQLEEGVFIPLERNGLKQGRTGKVCCRRRSMDGKGGRAGRFCRLFAPIR